MASTDEPADVATPTLAIPARGDATACAALCADLEVLVRNSATGIVWCEVVGLEWDLATVDTLARLQLTARRLGARLRLRHVDPAIEQLVVLAGLQDVLPCDPAE